MSRSGQGFEDQSAGDSGLGSASLARGFGEAVRQQLERHEPRKTLGIQRLPCKDMIYNAHRFAEGQLSHTPCSWTCPAAHTTTAQGLHI